MAEAVVHPHYDDAAADRVLDVVARLVREASVVELSWRPGEPMGWALRERVPSVGHAAVFRGASANPGGTL